MSNKTKLSTIVNITIIIVFIFLLIIGLSLTGDKNLIKCTTNNNWVCLWNQWQQSWWWWNNNNIQILDDIVDEPQQQQHNENVNSNDNNDDNILSGTPPSVPHSTDCMVRNLAYTFGIRAIKTTSLPTLYDALQLKFCKKYVVGQINDMIMNNNNNDNTNRPSDWNPPNYKLVDDNQQQSFNSESLLILWVDPMKGSDSTFQSGSQFYPLKSIQEALKRADKAKATKTQIILYGGTYHVEPLKPIEIPKTLTSSVEIRNAPNQQAIISGAEHIKIPLRSWKRITNPHPFFPKKKPNVIIWYAQLDEKTRVFDGLQSTAFPQQRLVRAKTPNGSPEQSGSSFVFGGDQAFGSGGHYSHGWFPKSPPTRVKWIPAPKPQHQPISEVIDSKSWPGVNWPSQPPLSNLDKTSIFTPRPGMGAQGPYTTGIATSDKHGACYSFTPPSGYFCNPQVPRGSQFHTRSPIGMHLLKSTTNHKKDKNEDIPATLEPGVIVTGWRGGEGGLGKSNPRWNTWTWVVGKSVENDNSTTHFISEIIDENTTTTDLQHHISTITFAHGGGVQGSQGSDDVEEWYVENSLKFLDDAGEWFFDDNTKRLYVAFNATNNKNDDELISTGGGPTGNEIWSFIRAKQLFHIKSGVTGGGITLTGLVFRDTALTWLDPHGMPSSGDWALPHSAAIVAEDVESLTIRDCLFERIDGNAILLRGKARGVIIERNTFAWLGGTGIVLWGRMSSCLDADCKHKLPLDGEGPDGRQGNQPRGTIIRYNVFRELGVFVKQSAAIFQALAGLSVIENNVMFNGPRSLLNFNDGFLGGDIVRGNLFANSVRESTDHGPINLWDRIPYIREAFPDRGERKPTVTPLERIFDQNFILGTYNVQAGIDSDDAASYLRSTRNVFVYGYLGLKSDFGGHHHASVGDLYIHITGSCFVPFPTLSPESIKLSLIFRNNTCLLSNKNGLGYPSRCHVDNKDRQDHQVLVGFNRVSGQVPLRVCNNVPLSNQLKKYPLLDPGTIELLEFPTDDVIGKMIREQVLLQ
jgi:hypothetical protein